MGFSHSWVAVQGLSAERVMEVLGMEASPAPRPGLFMDGVALIDLADWQLVISDNDEDAFEGRLSKLTLLGPAVACRINEHVMYSEARGYQAGENIWSVVHDPNGDESLYSLKISGNPPEQLEAIVRDVKAAQDSQGGEEADVDFIFDVAPKLAESICGFMLGEGELEAIRYTSLKPIGSPEPTEKRGFFARLFGGS